MRRAARIDNSHAPIVAALKKVGCRVLSLARVGDGCSDALILFRDKLFLGEFKSPEFSWQLTEAQKDFHSKWPVIVMETPEQAVNEIVRRGR